MEHYNKSLEHYIYNLGITDYMTALKMQEDLNKKVNCELIGDSFMFLEHNDIYTAGIHFHGELNNAVKVGRGGYMTYHGPGQLVVYYIVNLKNRNMNALDMIKKIQNDVINLLSIYGIYGRPELNEKTGVWVGDKKICSIGLGIKNFSTYHGIGLNISTDLSKFNAISPCNFSPEVMTSMERCSDKIFSLEDVKKNFIKITLESFEVKNYVLIENIN